MTELTYEINGVTVTSKGGGVYELSHAKLAEAEIVRGKEKADARAEDLGNELAVAPADEAEQPMAPQPLVPPTPTDLPTSESAPVSREQFDALMAKLNELQGKLSNAPTVSVGTEGDDTPGRIPAGTPRKFAGRMNAATRGLLTKYGMGIKTIVLEENTDIPPTGLFIGHNGTGYMIQPGVECDVPEFLLSVLDNAQTATPMVDQQTQKVLGYRSRTKYSYRVINKPD